MKQLLFILVIGCAALVLFLAARALFGGNTGAPSVVFVGMTNNPKRQMTPTRLEVCTGATGLCALFWVANIAPNRNIWFNTTAVERKTATGWQKYATNGGSWAGVEGSMWTPGYGCLYAVGWPSELPTNESWRLRVSYGRDLSSLENLINQKLERRIFTSGGQFRKGGAVSTIPSSEVAP